MKIAVQGYPFIVAALVLSALSFFWGWKLFAVATATLGIFFIIFFRDPDRYSSEPANAVLAPADGKVISIVKVSNSPLLEGERTRVSIFMSPLDVHINRMPMSGTIEEVSHRHGRYLAAYQGGAVEQNEQNAVRLADLEGRRVGVVQVAGFLARRIVCNARKGNNVRRGDRFGMIMFGSRTDLYLPPEAHILVAEGQKVRGGETVVGRFV
jgi:phosphatidylserine decarboxylase